MNQRVIELKAAGYSYSQAYRIAKQERESGEKKQVPKIDYFDANVSRGEFV